MAVDYRPTVPLPGLLGYHSPHPVSRVHPPDSRFPLLRLTTFGGLALSKDGVALTGAAAQRSRLSLLALLATAGSTGFSRDKLLLHLWPESDEERARHALKQAVYSVRRDLGAEDVIVGTAALSLNPEIISSDVREFEAAILAGDFATATGLYAGPFLDGFHLKDSVEFERWSGEQRARYAHMWSTAVEKLAIDLEGRGSWREAAGHWRSLASAEPLSGRLTLALIRALAESGDVGAAMSQYRVHESLLREELGTSPDPEVTKLADSIKAGTWQRSVPVRQRTGAPSLAHTMAIPSVRPPTPAASVATPQATPVAPPSRKRRWPLWVGSGVLVVLLIAGTAAYRSVDPSTRAMVRMLMSRKPMKINPRQIIVAPFENKTGDSTLDALGEQIADWFPRELNEAGFTVVDSRTARMDILAVQKTPVMFRAHDLGIALAEENGSEYVIVGSYYKSQSRLQANVSVIDVPTKQTVRSLGPVYGSRDSAEAFITSLLKPIVTYLAQAVDTTAGGRIVSNASPPSLESFERLSRAWEHFFAAPRDTVSVFAELDTAARLDATYATPMVMKGYILDVKSQWKQLNDVVKRLRPLVPRMSRIERAAMDLYEADLRGDIMQRLVIAQRLRELSPGSTEVPLLMVMSALYAGRPADAVKTLPTIDPDRGINLGTFIYWEWSALAYHEAGEYAAEDEAAKTGYKRFRYDAPMSYAMVRSLARRSDSDLRSFVDHGIPVSNSSSALKPDPFGDRIDLLLLAGRELRAHGHPEAATSYFAQASSELSTLPPNAPVDQRRRQAHAWYEAGDYARARQAFKSLFEEDTLDIEAEGRMAAAAAHLGDSATVKKVELHLRTMKRPFLMGAALRWRANLAAIRGNRAEACGLIEQAVRQGLRLLDTPVNFTIHVDGDFAGVLGSPEYKALLQTLAEGR